MQKVANSLKLNYPLDLVLQVTHFDLMRNMPSFTKLLGMEEIKLIRFDEHEDGSHDVEFTLKSKDRVPAFARTVIKPEMLVWRQIGKWDPETLTIDFKIVPHFFQRVIDIRGRKRYVEGAGCVTMEITSSISVGIPGIGRLMEQVIVSEVKKEQIKLLGKIEQEVKNRSQC